MSVDAILILLTMTLSQIASYWLIWLVWHWEVSTAGQLNKIPMGQKMMQVIQCALAFSYQISTQLSTIYWHAVPTIIKTTLKMFWWLMVPQNINNTLCIVFLSFVTYFIWLGFLIYDIISIPSVNPFSVQVVLITLVNTNIGNCCLILHNGI